MEKEFTKESLIPPYFLESTLKSEYKILENEIHNQLPELIQSFRDIINLINECNWEEGNEAFEDAYERILSAVGNFFYQIDKTSRESNFQENQEILYMELIVQQLTIVQDGLDSINMNQILNETLMILGIEQHSPISEDLFRETIAQKIQFTKLKGMEKAKFEETTDPNISTTPPPHTKIIASRFTSLEPSAVENIKKKPLLSLRSNTRSKIVSAIALTGALLGTASLIYGTTHGTKKEDSNSSDAPQAESLLSNETPPIAPSTDPKLKEKARLTKLTCTIDTTTAENPQLAIFLGKIRRNTPPYFSKAISESISATKVEISIDQDQISQAASQMRTRLFEHFLEKLCANDNPHIQNFAVIHQENFKKFKEINSWRQGMEQTKQLFEVMEPVCQ